MALLAERRLGRFFMPLEWVDVAPDNARKLLADCIVVGAIIHPDRGLIEYRAMHPAFEQVPVADMVADYVPNLTGDVCAWSRVGATNVYTF